jgi:hypothetical protein
VLDLLEPAAVTHEVRVGFGSALDGARFAAAGTVGHDVGRDHAKQFVEEFLTLSFGTGLE